MTMETSFFRRSFAWIIDKIIIIPLFFITNVVIFGAYEAPGLFGYAMGSLDSTPFEAERYTPNNYLITFIAIFLAVNRVYYLLCELLFKRTLGKFVAKLEIRNMDSSPITVFKSFLRVITYWGSYLIILFILSLVFHNSVTWSKIILLTYIIILLVPLYITNGTQTLYDLISLSKIAYTKQTKTVNIKTTHIKDDPKNSTVSFNEKKHFKLFKLLSIIFVVSFIVLSYNYTLFKSENEKYQSIKNKWENEKSNKINIDYKNNLNIYNVEMVRYESDLKKYYDYIPEYNKKLKNYNSEVAIYDRKISNYNRKLDKWLSGLSRQSQINYSYMKRESDVSGLLMSSPNSSSTGNSHDSKAEFKKWLKRMGAPNDDDINYPYPPSNPYPTKPNHPHKESLGNYPSYESVNNISNSPLRISFKRNPIKNIFPISLLSFIIISSLVFIFIYIKATIKEFTENDIRSNWSIILISIVLSFFLLNSALRYYCFYNYINNPHNSYDLILDNYLFRTFILSLLSILSFQIINRIYTKLKLNKTLYFPLNKGLNRLLMVFWIISSCYNEIIVSINNNFRINNTEWNGLTQFKNNGSTFYSGIFLFILLFCAYLIFVWIYRGFKEKR